MSDDRDVTQRLRRLEANEDKLAAMVTHVEKGIDRMTILLDQMGDMPLRLRELEIEMVNQKIVGKAVQWLGITVCSTGIILVATFLFEGKV
tara:strand:+ start:366 stop:638 length:273 start_codon:yes stop_codon:yes gene_type:complete